MDYNFNLGREQYQSVETLTEIFYRMQHFHMNTHGSNIRTAVTIGRTADLQLEPWAQDLALQVTSIFCCR